MKCKHPMKIECALLVFLVLLENVFSAFPVNNGQFRSRILIPSECKSFSSRILFSWADEFMLKNREKQIELSELWRTNPGSFQEVSLKIEESKIRSQNSTLKLFHGKYGFNLNMILSLFSSPLISILINMYISFSNAVFF